MKKVLFSILAIGVLASCTKTEPVFTEVDQEIKITPVTSLATKANVNNAIDGTIYPKEEDFIVNAFWDGENGEENVQYLIDAVFANKGKYWGGKTATYYWPKNGSLRFAAYSPAEINDGPSRSVEYDVKSDTYTVNYTQATNTAETVDILFAPISKPYTAETATENVSVVFEHALSWITIKVKAANAVAASAFKINEVIVNDVNNVGTLTAAMANGIQYEEWTSKSGEVDYTVVSGQEIALTTVAENVEEAVEGGVQNGLLFIPQDPTTLTINFQQQEMEGTPALGKQTVTVPLELDEEGAVWEPGKHYIYTVIFDVDEILINPSVVDWEDVVVEDKDSDDAGQIATVATEEELLAALEAEIPEIEVTADIALTSQLAIDYNVAITGGGFTGETIVVTGGVVSFQDVAFANANGTDQTSVYVRDGNTNVTFENCTFDAYTWEAIQVTSENSLWVCVDGCTFNGEAHRDLHLQVKNASKAEVKITNNIFNGDDADSYVTIYGYEHERMILADNVTEEPANTMNVWISNVFDENDRTIEGFVKPAAYTAALTASAILSENYNGADMVTGVYDLFGNGYTFTMAEGTTMFGVTTSAGIIADLNVVGYNKRNTNGKVLYGVVVTKNDGDVILRNVTSTDVAYPFNTQTTGKCDYTLTVENCTLEGWTSFDSFKSAAFINTAFKIGDFFASEDPSELNVWNGNVRPYVTTVFDGCSFDKYFNIDLSKLASDATVTMKNCTVEGVVLTAANVADYLTIDGDWTDVKFE